MHLERNRALDSILRNWMYPIDKKKCLEEKKQEKVSYLNKKENYPFKVFPI